MSRCDLLSVFLRPDEDIARAVREMLAELPQADPGGVTVAVRNGIVTLAGLLGSAEEHDLIQVAGRVAWDIVGVVDVVNNLGITQPVTSSTPRHREVPLKPDEFLGADQARNLRHAGQAGSSSPAPTTSPNNCSPPRRSTPKP